MSLLVHNAEPSSAQPRKHAGSAAELHALGNETGHGDLLDAASISSPLQQMIERALQPGLPTHDQLVAHSSDSAPFYYPTSPQPSSNNSTISLSPPPQPHKKRRRKRPSPDTAGTDLRDEPQGQSLPVTQRSVSTSVSYSSSTSTTSRSTSQGAMLHEWLRVYWPRCLALVGHVVRQMRDLDAQRTRWVSYFSGSGSAPSFSLLLATRRLWSLTTPDTGRRQMCLC